MSFCTTLLGVAYPSNSRAEGTAPNFVGQKPASRRLARSHPIWIRRFVGYVRRNTLCVVRHEAKEIRGPGNPLLSRGNTLVAHVLYVFKFNVRTHIRAQVS